MLQYAVYVVLRSAGLEYCGELMGLWSRLEKVAVIQCVPYGTDRGIVSAWFIAISRDLGIIRLQRST